MDRSNGMTIRCNIHMAYYTYEATARKYRLGTFSLMIVG